MSGSKRRVRILADEETASFLAEELTGAGETVVDRAPVADPGRLALDLGTVESIVALVSALFIEGPIITRLWERMRSGKTQKLVFEGPLRKVTIEAKSDLTQEEIKAAFRLVTGMVEP
ncbi:hypothetical protein ABZU32_00080 [Sphaerisporangium sp. NPDC005288]|uniref:hypothetical protein n=1 Tax=Sphaerisporangium sp. NPDC005288 TaxID=3155114 RepID=UPI0033A79A53